MARKNIVVIYSMKPYNDAAPFSKNQVLAVIPDARDIGVQMYANDSGYAYFTIPVDHPAAPLIQPLKQHYSVQRWDGSAYVDIQSGIITDYDAGVSEIVVNGVDYMTALNKYYTQIHGPKIGDKAIPSSDTRSISAGGNGSTPKSVIAQAASKDLAKKSEGYWVPVVDSVYPNVGKIEIYDGVPDNVQPGTAGNTWGNKDKLKVTYQEDVNGKKTGAVIIEGCQYIWRDVSSAYFQDGETGKTIEGNFSIGTSASNKGWIGLVLYAQPGGALLDFSTDHYFAPSEVEIGGYYSALGGIDAPMPFTITLRPSNHYNSADEDHTGRERVYSILTEGVSYEFYAIPYYIGNLSPVSGSDYNQGIWGTATSGLDTTFTAGLQTDTVPGAISALLATPADPQYVLDRTNDYPVSSEAVASTSMASSVKTVIMSNPLPENYIVGDTVTGASSTLVSGASTDTSGAITSISSDRKTIVTAAGTASSGSSTGGTLNKTNTALVPLVKFTTLNQLNTASSSVKHPYTTAGQGPVDFLRDLADIEMGSRMDGTKVVFNYYGVPGASATGASLIVNHAVSANPQDVLVYPGSIKGFNVTSRLSSKVNSVRVVPTTDFLIGASTEAASGAKSQGVVKVSQYNVSDPSLPIVQSQSGFLSSQSAGNFAQGLVNDFGQDDDVRSISVQLRTDLYGPIGAAGTPKLGETVRVVIRRKSAGIGVDEVSGLYNVGGMEWHARIDGHEDLMLDLAKPSKFKGPAVSWGATPGTPKPDQTKPTRNPAPPPPPGNEPGKKDIPPDPMALPNLNIQPGRGGAYIHALHMANKPAPRPRPGTTPKVGLKPWDPRAPRAR
jgi:hypothetical protein